MAKKRAKNKPIIAESEQTLQCKNYLEQNGYAVFRVDDLLTEESIAVEKLKAVGYKVEHIRDALVKVDPTRVSSADDIVLYFYEKLKRYNKKLVKPNILVDRKLRLVDCSIVNSLIKWRMVETGAALKEVIEDLFIMIDLLFEKAQECDLDIRSLGIISINVNKPLLLALLREVKLLRDKQLEFKIESQLKEADQYSYLRLLDSAREQLEQTHNQTKVKAAKRHIHIGDS